MKYRSPFDLKTPSLGLLNRLPFVAVGQRGERPVRLEPGDPAVAVLAEDQPALWIHQQAVRARLTASRRRAGVAARLQEDARLPCPACHWKTVFIGTSEKSKNPARRSQTGPSDQSNPSAIRSTRRPGHELVKRGSSRSIVPRVGVSLS